MNSNSNKAAGDSSAMGIGELGAVIKRRKWLLIAMALLVPAVAIVMSMRQPAQFQGQAQVLLNQMNTAMSFTNTTDPGMQGVDGDRVATTQASLALTPTVAERTLKAAGVTDMTPQELIDQSVIEQVPGSDILSFAVTAGDKEESMDLTNEYAKQYTIYRQELDTAAARRALREVNERLANLPAGSSKGPQSLYQSLTEKQQQLRTFQTLQTSNATVVKTESDPEQIAPTPARNGLLGLILGLVIGIGLVFVREALDRRPRSPEDLADSLEMPLLGRLRIAKRRDVAVTMLADPSNQAAESYRVLRHNLEFMSLANQIKSIMVTSAIEHEGKSTALANLAVAYARAGKRVALVDLDLRKPAIQSLFGLGERAGVTNVALGQYSLESVLVGIPVVHEGEMAAVSARARHGSLAVLPAGSIPPDAHEFLVTDELAQILDQLSSQFDLVLVDAPPTLSVSDPLVIATRVDGLVVVANMDVETDKTIAQLSQSLRTVSARVLGVVAVGTAEDLEMGGTASYRSSYYRPAVQQAGVA